MLKADIALSDLSFDPCIENEGVSLGESRISPFPHPSLETLLVRTEDQWFISIRERCMGKSSSVPISTMTVGYDAFRDLYRASLMWPLDYIMIEGARQGCRLKLKAGVIGSAPIYCIVADGRVTVSWDFSDFMARSPWLDMEILSHYLALNTVYSSRQVCVGINLITERSTLYAEPGKALFRYPPPAEEVSPQERSCDSNEVLAEFGSLLHRAITTRSMASGKIALELSGGMDSATVACAVTATHGSIVSKGILLDGDVRISQMKRRQQIVTKLGLTDDPVDMSAFPPSLDLQLDRGRVERPNGEYYLEAFEALWGSIQEQGCNVLFTGIGGDELFPVYFGEVPQSPSVNTGVIEGEHAYAAKLLTKRARSAASVSRTFDAPYSPVGTSVLLSHVCQAPHLLRRGIWPVNPLGDPDLIAFCHRLSKENRLDRGVMQSYLQAVLGDVFPRSYVKETFIEVLPEVISKNAKMIASQLRTCALSDLGLIDQRAALKLLDDIVSTRSFTLAAPFATFLWLERFVRQLN